jgi:hypothetical protein
VVSNFLDDFIMNAIIRAGQSVFIPHRHDCICNSSYRRSLSRAARWFAQVQPRRMNSLAMWGSSSLNFVPSEPHQVRLNTI